LRDRVPAGIHPFRVFPKAAAQVSAAQAVMLRSPVTKPMPKDGQRLSILQPHTEQVISPRFSRAGSTR
jgi:hypothetical protein